MAYKTFANFCEIQKTQSINENIDKMVQSIIESGIPFDVFYNECFLPFLMETHTDDPFELIVEADNWFQRNMPTFSKMFGMGPKAPTGPSPEEQEAIAKNQAFQQKHGDTFKKVKAMFINGLLKTTKELQNNVLRYPNANLLVTALENLARNAGKATQSYEFQQGTNDFYDKFKQSQQTTGQQNAITSAIASGDTQKLLRMPDEQIISAIEGQPQMRQQLTQLAKNINQQIQDTSDPAQKQNLQNQLRRVMNLTKYGMGAEFTQSAARGQAQRSQLDKVVNDRNAQAQARTQAAQEAKEREEFDSLMYDKLLANPDASRRPQDWEEVQHELDRLWQEKKRRERAASRSSVRGGSSPVPTAPVGSKPMSFENTLNQQDMLIESLIRCTGSRK